MHSTAALPALFLASLASLAAPSTEHRDAPVVEPALRVRVTIGSEVVDASVGVPTRTGDGRPVLVEVLPTRTFRVPSEFAFEYPKDWRYGGSVGVPTPVDAWWHLGGDGAAFTLRRHAQGARETLDTYVANLQLCGGHSKTEATLDLGGRVLSGHAVTMDVGSIGRGTPSSCVQEVYAWEQEEGVSWLITVQREVHRGEYDVTAVQPFVIRLAGEPLEPTPVILKPPSELDQLLASFRWEE